jgi:UDP-GlcNAc:undecaprenyl-phosphate/decaprenyl-phosphate GlcNAc-1-phosphate transferase
VLSLVFGTQELFLIFVVPFVVTVTAIVALRPLAPVVGLVDRPGGRKQHLGNVPLTGGLAMTAGLLVGALFMPPMRDGYGYFAAGVCLLAIVGVLDDRFDLPKYMRLIAQTTAAVILVVGSVQVDDLGHLFQSDPVELGPLSAAFTILVVVTAINAFNVFDGSHGIAGGQALVALSLFGWTATVRNVQIPALILALGACVAGFLIFNWPTRRGRALAFMGDAGSMVLGFALARLSIRLSQGDARALAPICVAWVFSLPIYDLFSSMVRRVAAGRSPLSADDGHIHHLLRRHFGAYRPVAYVLVTTAAALGFVGIYAHLNGVPDGVLLIAWLVLGVVHHVIFGTSLIVRWRRASLAATPATGPESLA